MKGYMKPIIIAIVAGDGAAYAANETVTMNAIDAGGIGRKSVRSNSRTPKLVCGLRRAWWGYRRATMVSISTLIQISDFNLDRSVAYFLGYRKAETLSQLIE